MKRELMLTAHYAEGDRTWYIEDNEDGYIEIDAIIIDLTLEGISYTYEIIEGRNQK